MDLTQRICCAFNKSQNIRENISQINEHSMWTNHYLGCPTLKTMGKNVIDDIEKDNYMEVLFHLKNPVTHMMCYGFDNLFIGGSERETSSEIMYILLNLCRSIGKLPVINYETPLAVAEEQKQLNMPIEDILYLMNILVLK